MAALLVLACGASAAEDPWADGVVAYSPVNPPSGFTDPSRALGRPAGGGPNVPNNGDVVSLGSAGGSITLRFDTAVTDDPLNPFGIDAIVYGNALWVGGNPQRRFQEPGVIEISVDANANGLADDPWYLIPGSLGLSPAPFPVVNEPAGGDNEPPFPATLIAGAIRNPLGAAAESLWGYADTNPTAAEFLDNAVRPDDPLAVGITSRSGGGDGFDIATALDGAGNPAGIDRFHFIRITTLVSRDMGALGFASTEIAAVADVAPAVDTDGDGILDEYETRVAGTDPLRPESTILPLEIPALEGGSPAGALLGAAADGAGNRIRLFSIGPRTGFPRVVTTAVDMAAATDPGGALPVGGLIKSGAVRTFSVDVASFAAAQVDDGEFTIAYTAGEIAGLDESSLTPFRFEGGAYTAAGVSSVEAVPQANRVTFRSAVAGTFLLAGPAGTGDDAGPGPKGAIALTAAPVDEAVVGPATVVTFSSGGIVDQDDAPVADGTLFTVTASAGTLLTADADGALAGVQVTASGGAIAFTLRAPNTAQSATIAAASVEGSAFGELDYTFYAGPPTGAVEFNPGEPESDGPIAVRMTSGIVRDAYWNVVRDGTLLTITASAGTLTSGDADETAPGHQVVVENGRAVFVIELPNEFTPWTLNVYADSDQTNLLGTRSYDDSDYPEMPLAITAILAAALAALGLRRARRV